MHPVDQYPYISLDEHYEYGNPLTTDTVGYYIKHHDNVSITDISRTPTYQNLMRKE